MLAGVVFYHLEEVCPWKFNLVQVQVVKLVSRLDDLLGVVVYELLKALFLDGAGLVVKYDLENSLHARLVVGVNLRPDRGKELVHCFAVGRE